MRAGQRDDGGTELCELFRGASVPRRVVCKDRTGLETKVLHQWSHNHVCIPLYRQENCQKRGLLLGDGTSCSGNGTFVA
jgi:hypothetical protein